VHNSYIVVCTIFLKNGWKLPVFVKNSKFAEFTWANIIRAGLGHFPVTYFPAWIVQSKSNILETFRTNALRTNRTQTAKMTISRQIILQLNVKYRVLVHFTENSVLHHRKFLTKTAINRKPSNWTQFSRKIILSNSLLADRRLIEKPKRKIHRKVVSLKKKWKMVLKLYHMTEKSLNWKVDWLEVFSMNGHFLENSFRSNDLPVKLKFGQMTFYFD
jgi:hypothetical protein